MTRKKDDKSIGKVTSSGGTKAVRGTSSVSEVEKVTGANAVRGVGAVRGVRSTSGVSSISFEQREKLMSMVSEEAEKLAAAGTIPKNQREIVEQAVKMIIDATLLEPDTDKAKK